MPIGRRRDDALAVAVAAIALAVMAARLPSGPTSPSWLWLSWLGAAAFLSLLSPTVQGALRELCASRAARVALIAGVALAGPVIGLASGAVPAWRVLAWPLVVVLAAAAVGETGEGTEATKSAAWRLIAAALALGLLAGLWDRGLRTPVPGGMGIGLSFFAAAALALFLLRSVRPLHTLDVGLGLGAREVAVALGAALALAALALPLGILAEYAAWNPRPGTVLGSLERWFGLVIFVGIPEEVLFRGLIQEGLTRLKGPRFGWLAGSLLFGVAHIGKSTGLLPEQVNALGLNWRYAALATLAGLAYGWVYLRTRRISAAALTHGSVDWLWSSFFLR